MTQNHHIVDDEGEYQEEELQFLRDSSLTQWKQNYHVLSIIGAQSSGKSTLLNQLFQTKFEVLNRKQRIGQTTKGIWMAVDPKLRIVILDVEGSDSKERQETRTKTQRCNSLFALAVSNTLIVNIWKQQLGLWKGSQLAILEIVLELNLKLFKSERPKEIIFVVRDYEPDNAQNDSTQTIKKNIFGRVQEAWNKINKPQGTQDVKLQQLFHLNVFFLPSFRQQKELFRQQVVKLRQFLIKISQNSQLTDKNVLVQNIPQFLKNLWQTIQSDKDLNLPAQKILIANLRCNQIKTEALQKIQQPFNRVIDKALTTLNREFSNQVGSLVDEAFAHYDKQTQLYPKEEVQKIRDQFMKQLEHSIFASFKSQVNILSSECIADVTDKLTNVIEAEQSNDSSIKKLNDIKQDAFQKFKTTLAKLAYKSAWIQEVSKEFIKDLAKAVQVGKNKILMDYLSQLDSIFKKKVDGAVTGLLKNKQSFVQPGFFWEQLKKEYGTLIAFGQNGIRNRLQLLDLPKNSNQHYFQRSKSFCYEQLKSIVIARIKDINYYLSRHFKNQFNFDERKVPRNWPDIAEQKIDQIYKNAKKQFQDSIAEFQYFEFDENKHNAIREQPTSVRASVAVTSSSSNRKLVGKTLDDVPTHELILGFQKIDVIKKNYNEMCDNQYKQAKRKHNDKYKGRIPKWMLVLLAVFMVDDVLLWFSSPALIIPVTIIGILIAIVVHKLGMGPAQALLGQATQIGSGLLGSITGAASNSVAKKNQ